MARLKLVGQGAAVGLVVALLGLLVWKVAQQDDPGGVAAAFERGERPQAPAFSLRRVSGDGTIELASLRGQVVVLNFWASWCNPCKKEMPRLEAAWRRYRQRGVTLVGVNSNDFTGDARTFLKRFGVTYPNVRDGNGRVLVRYGGLPIPWTFFIDRKGRIVSYVHGEVSGEALNEGIGEALEA
jgi:peroxiredoxin